MGHLKFVIDGALGSRTAALFEPYDDVDDNGLLLYEAEEFYKLIKQAHTSNWDIACHAIGDRAIDFVLNAYEKVQSEHPRSDARHRIEHCMICSIDQIKRIKNAGLVIVAQPEFLYYFEDGYTQALGDRILTAKPFKSCLNAGIPVAFSSDKPITPGDPLMGIKTAVTRTGMNGKKYSSEECLDPMMALKLYTIGSAYAIKDDKLGMLKTGMRGDFTVLSGHPDKIIEQDIKVIGTSHSIKTDNQN
jgi:predicted amidohydrolase YtcJ